jgi:hypothetical protein
MLPGRFISVADRSAGDIWQSGKSSRTKSAIEWRESQTNSPRKLCKYFSSAATKPLYRARPGRTPYFFEPQPLVFSRVSSVKNSGMKE